jgi:hypothetical protein
VSESESETLSRGRVRHLATILGVKIAFIATADPGPDRLQMLALHLNLDFKKLGLESYAGQPLTDSGGLV